MNKKQLRRYRPVHVAIWALTMLVGVALATTDVRAGTTTPPAQADRQPAAIPTSSGIIVFAMSKWTPNSPQGGSAVFSMNPNGGAAQLLTPAGGIIPDVSTDGSKIAYMIGGDIWVMDINGGNKHNITNTPAAYDSDPTWSSDISILAYTTVTNTYTQTFITVANADGSNAHAITTSPGFSMPTWSGNKIAAAYLSNGSWDIYTMNSDGTNLQNITNSPTVGEFMPSWSPDGTVLAFVRALADTVTYEIFVMNADGTNQHNLTNNTIQDSSPDWSPDGTEIVFMQYDEDFSMELMVMSANGTNQHNITNTPESFEHYPSWGFAGIRPVVLVRGESGQPVQGAEVYRECTLVGTTDINGTIALTGTPALYDRLIARQQVHEGSTQKGAHDGWSYHVWLTNIKQESDGSETPYVVNDTGQLTHTLVISPTSAKIGFNIVASVEYNDTPHHLDQIKAGFMGANEYLLDLTDGQMYFEQVKIYDNKENWDHADFQFKTWQPRANADAEPDGISALTSPEQHIRMHSRGDFDVPYTQLSAQTTLVHEFAHYAIGAYDEYYKFNIDDYTTQCTLNFDSVNYDSRASAMFDQRESSEFCATIAPVQHNSDTAQGYIQGESVWQTLVDNWSDDLDLWELESPLTTGVVNMGPFSPLCLTAFAPAPQVFNAPASGCDTIQVKSVYENGEPFGVVDVYLYKNGDTIEQGYTDNDGKGTVLGAAVGDTIHMDILLGADAYNGDAEISNCTDEVVITLRQTNGPASLAPNAEVPTAWPPYWLETVPDWTTNIVTVTLHLGADPPAQPTIYASQDGANRQQVALTYNSGLHQYTGTYTFNPAISPDFLFELERPADGGVSRSAYTFLGGRFHASGPSGYDKIKNRGTVGQNPNSVPIAWNLLRPETIADLIVNPNSLPDSTGVMVGETGFPASAPTNFIPVGGPYSLHGQHPISGEVGIILSYQSEYFCGLQPGTTSIYRYTGTGWEAIPTSLIPDWHQVGGKITQWGIYGVFAQPNAQTTFSDVPVGSTFYDYIRWMTCHGIASGYSDNTFRPNNNATRGQISKMISLAYQWYLEPPANNYTFADVLPGSTFHLYVEAAYREGVVSGYPCGGAGEPCDPQNRPYFRPSNNVTRGQIAKIISNGSKFTDPVSGQTFEDVPAGSTFHEFVERMASRTIINGYACGGPGEPCVPPGNRPYFRPAANATRGQLSKMIYLAASPR